MGELTELGLEEKQWKQVNGRCYTSGLLAAVLALWDRVIACYSTYYIFFSEEISLCKSLCCNYISLHFYWSCRCEADRLFFTVRFLLSDHCLAGHWSRLVYWFLSDWLIRSPFINVTQTNTSSPGNFIGDKELPHETNNKQQKTTNGQFNCIYAIN